MPDGIKISELAQVPDLTNNDLFPVCQPSAQSDTGFLTRRCTTLDLAYKLFGDILYTSQLHTTAKTGWGAINELKAGLEASDKKLEDHALITLDDCTFSAYVANDLITFTIPLSNGLESVTEAEIYSLYSESFTIPGVLNAGSLSTLGDVSFILAQGIGVIVKITNLASTPAATGANCVHCEQAMLYFTYTEPES